METYDSTKRPKCNANEGKIKCRYAKHTKRTTGLSFGSDNGDLLAVQTMLQIQALNQVSIPMTFKSVMNMILITVMIRVCKSRHEGHERVKRNASAPAWQSRNGYQRLLPSFTWFGEWNRGVDIAYCMVLWFLIEISVESFRRICTLYHVSLSENSAASNFPYISSSILPYNT